MLLPTGVIFLSSNMKKRSDAPDAPDFDACAKKAKGIGDKLTRNIAVATLVLLAVAGFRSSGPGGKSILTAAQNVIESEWDQNVGKLTYVNSTLADSLQVFRSDRSGSLALTVPVSAAAAAPWSESEPYLLYHNAGSVHAAAPGEVTQIIHDDSDHSIVRLTHADGLSSVYYGLQSCFVSEGDTVDSDTVLGQSGDSFAFEVQKYGKPIDCTPLLQERKAAQ